MIAIGSPRAPYHHRYGEAAERAGPPLGRCGGVSPHRPAAMQRVAEASLALMAEATTLRTHARIARAAGCPAVGAGLDRMRTRLRGLAAALDEVVAGRITEPRHDGGDPE